MEKKSPLKDVWWRLAFIALIIGLCIWAIVPPSQKIRLGKDLQGGVSLIYHVRIDPNDPDPEATLNQVITVLKDRVNPTGVLDIAMRPLGRDRIEIVMPLPNETVRALRRDYEAALEDLLAEGLIAPSELQTALVAGNAPDVFGAGGERGERISELQGAYDTYQEALDALEAAEQRGAGAEDLGRLAQAVADAQVEFEELRERVLNMSLTGSQVERTIRLSTERDVQRDTAGRKVLDAAGKEIPAPSAREVAANGLKSEFPYLAGRIDAVVAAYDAYAAKRTGFDDPEDLMRLLRGAGVLEFHIAVRASDPAGVNPDDMRSQLDERGAAHTDSPVARWYPINDVKQWYKTPEQLESLAADPVAYFARPGYDLVAGERDGQYYLLLYTTNAKSIVHEQGRSWGVESTGRTIDNFGRAAVRFELDDPGGALMNRLTSTHINEPMAIVLDDQVYSAPNINSTIGKNGIIVGNFSESELNYLIRVLAAGSLEAKLTPDPIAINTLGPSIGADNLRAGLEAFVVAIFAVAAFMFLYYFFAGAVADMALIINGVIIFGVMSLIDGTFTLPGLAGIVLTIGMAVDANVLIYERIREELFGGESDLRIAIKQGYAKAFSTIIDANVTNLIICAVLYRTATTEVKGFAVTLSIGILATLFTALFVTRQVYILYTELFGFKRLAMLPTVVPSMHRALEPAINWMGLRKVFFPVSIVLVACAIMLVAARGVDMFDTEFRGGVAVTLLTAPIDADRDDVPDQVNDDGSPLRRWLPQTGQGGVEQRVQNLGGLLKPGADPVKQQRLLSALHGAGVIDRGPDELSSADLATDPGLNVVRAVLDELGRSSVLTVGRTEIRDGVVHSPSYQIKVASPKGIDEESTITDIVVSAVVTEFGDVLEVMRPLEFQGSGDSDHTRYTYPITKPSLGENIGRPRHTDDVGKFLGGVAVVLDDVDPPVMPDDVANRVARMRAQPDFSDYAGREVEVIGLEPADRSDPSKGYGSLVVLVHEYEGASYFDDFEVWDRALAEVEWTLVSQAMKRQTSLEQVSSFSSAVAATLAANAIVAVILSLLGILLYIWVRFGSLRYSIAAIVALVHDVSLSLGFLALTGWIGGTTLAVLFHVEEFQIDLGVVAALLTIIGYSLNDTIVILDRIRENRGKLPVPTAAIVNKSINQTVSRTVLTSFTTLLAVLIMYFAGGSGIRPFAYTLVCGLIVGTYSSVAIAAPLVLRGGPAGSGGEGGEAVASAGALARESEAEPSPALAAQRTRPKPA